MYLTSTMWCDTHGDIARDDAFWSCRSSDGDPCLWERVVLVPTATIKLAHNRPLGDMAPLDFHFGLGERWVITESTYKVVGDAS